eukprot:TRINITY_DN12988_c0_g1_i1.p1 TRINITY_DN12988_c0_g1~~TRINITY_DN12988_c0_g1_i1.p1  ORF type:complete len:353 (-),score=18.09 TRINITY_DN12988_c0_g1_i1:366-1424(-)
MINIRTKIYFIPLVIMSLLFMFYFYKNQGINEMVVPVINPGDPSNPIKHDHLLKGKWVEEFSFEKVCGEHINREWKTKATFTAKNVIRSKWDYLISLHDPTVELVSGAVVDQGGFFDHFLMKWIWKFHKEGIEIVNDNSIVNSNSAFKKDWIMFDIGANIGTESFFAASKGHLVFAFEPFSFNYHKICDTVYLNHWENRVFIIPKAFSDYKGSTKICIHSDNMGWAQIDPSACQGIEHEIQVEILDDFVEEYEIPINKTHYVVHLDTEGSEAKIISRGNKFFGSPYFQFIDVEISADEETGIAITSFFRKLGFYIGLSYEDESTKYESLFNPWRTSDYIFMRFPWKYRFDNL